MRSQAPCWNPSVVKAVAGASRHGRPLHSCADARAGPLRRRRRRARGRPAPARPPGAGAARRHRPLRRRRGRRGPLPRAVVPRPPDRPTARVGRCARRRAGAGGGRRHRRVRWMWLPPALLAVAGLRIPYSTDPLRRRAWSPSTPPSALASRRWPGGCCAGGPCRCASATSGRRWRRSCCSAPSASSGWSTCRPARTRCSPSTCRSRCSRRWWPSSTPSGCRWRGAVVLQVGLAVVFALVGIYQWATETIWWNDLLETANRYTSSFRVNSLFISPAPFGRFEALALITIVGAARARPAAARDHRAGSGRPAAAGRPRALLLAHGDGGDGRRPGGAVARRAGAGRPRSRSASARSPPSCSRSRCRRRATPSPAAARSSRPTASR